MIFFTYIIISIIIKGIYIAQVRKGHKLGPRKVDL